MANRRFGYLDQLLTHEEYDDSNAQLEAADRSIAADLGFLGVVAGLSVVQKGSPTLHVDVSSGTAYDQLGQRIRVPGTQDVNCALDKDGVSTAVTQAGYTKIVSIFVKFRRSASDPRLDGNNATVYWVNDESFELQVIGGTEVLSPAVPTAPALLADGILLADITLSYGQTQILTANINLTGRRQDLAVITDTPRSLRATSWKGTIAALLALYNDHVDGSADQHGGAALTLAVGPTWANGTTNPSESVQDRVDSIVSDLASVASNSGAHKIGVAAQTGAPGAIAASNLFDRLEALRLASNLSYAGGTIWADLSTNPPASVETQLDKIVVDLGGVNGAGKIGAAASGGLLVGSVRSQLDQLQTEKAALAGAAFTGTVSIASGQTLRIDPARVELSPAISGAARSCKTPMIITAGAGTTGRASVSGLTIEPGDAAEQQIDAPNGSVITGVTIYVDPQAGSPLPGQRVSARVWSRVKATGVATALSPTVVDPNATTGAYQPYHSFSVALTSSETVNHATNLYWIELSGELPTNEGNVIWRGSDYVINNSVGDFT